MPSSMLSEMVCNLTLKYWAMANIPTVDIRTVVARIGKLVGLYEKLVKSKTKQNPAQVKEREEFFTTVAELFYIASSVALTINDFY